MKIENEQVKSFQGRLFSAVLQLSTLYRSLSYLNWLWDFLRGESFFTLSHRSVKQNCSHSVCEALSSCAMSFTFTVKNNRIVEQFVE